MKPAASVMSTRSDKLIKVARQYQESCRSVARYIYCRAKPHGGMQRVRLIAGLEMIVKL
jgi:hypothetical protein